MELLWTPVVFPGDLYCWCNVVTITPYPVKLRTRSASLSGRLSPLSRQGSLRVVAGRIRGREEVVSEGGAVGWLLQWRLQGSV